MTGVGVGVSVGSIRLTCRVTKRVADLGGRGETVNWAMTKKRRLPSGCPAEASTLTIDASCDAVNVAPKICGVALLGAEPTLVVPNAAPALHGLSMLTPGPEPTRSVLHKVAVGFRVPVPLPTAGDATVEMAPPVDVFNVKVLGATVTTCALTIAAPKRQRWTRWTR